VVANDRSSWATLTQHVAIDQTNNNFLLNPCWFENWKQGSWFPNLKPHLRVFKNLLEVSNWSIDDLRPAGSLGVVML
jgi:hypothetical protein